MNDIILGLIGYSVAKKLYEYTLHFVSKKIIDEEYIEYYGENIDALELYNAYKECKKMNVLWDSMPETFTYKTFTFTKTKDTFEWSDTNKHNFSSSSPFGYYPSTYRKCDFYVNYKRARGREFKEIKDAVDEAIKNKTFNTEMKNIVDSE